MTDRRVFTGGIRVAALAGATVTLVAQAPADFGHERQVLTAGAGPQRLAVDEALLAGAAPFHVMDRGELRIAEQGLADLRLFTDGERSVPYLLMQPASTEPEWVSGRILTVPPTKNTSGFEVDLGSARTVDRLGVEDMPQRYLKRVTLEGSGDRARWTMLVAEGTLFDLPEEELRQDTLAFTPGSYRYLRVIWNDSNSGRVPSPPAVRARLASLVPAPAPTTIGASVERRPSEPGMSRFHIRLPAPGLPVVALDLAVGGGHVYRRVTVTESRFMGVEAAPVKLGSATLARVTRDGVTAAALRIPIEPPSEADLELNVEDGANAPLDVQSVSVVLAQLPWIYFEAPAGRVVARYGNKTLQRPSYDLEAVRGSVDLRRLPDAHWGADTALTAAKPAAQSSLLSNAGPGLDPSVFTTARPIASPSAGLVALRLDAHALSNSLGPSRRFADVRVLDGSNHQIPYLVERRDEPLSIDLPLTPARDSKAEELKPAKERSRSVYAVTLPYPRMPASTLVIETSARVFQRTSWVGIDRGPDRYRRDPWFDVKASQTWRHADAETAAQPLTVPLRTMDETELRLAIDEGDNAPLPITSARLLLPAYRLRFYSPAGESLRLVYGRQDLHAPQYDLALLAPQVMGAAATEIAAAAAPVTAPSNDTPLVSRTLFWSLLSLAVVVLLALIVRLIRAQT